MPPWGCDIDAEQEHDGRENEDEADVRRGGHPHPEDDNGIGDDGGIQEQFGSGALIFGGDGQKEAKRLLAERVL